MKVVREDGLNSPLAPKHPGKGLAADDQDGGDEARFGSGGTPLMGSEKNRFFAEYRGK